jgi:hypothetical protein
MVFRLAAPRREARANDPRFRVPRSDPLFPVFLFAGPCSPFPGPYLLSHFFSSPAVTVFSTSFFSAHPRRAVITP